MAVKSVIDIDVNDQAFKNYLRLFKQYEAAAGKLPQSWRAQREEAKQAYQATIKATQAQTLQNQMRAKAEERAAYLSMTTSQRWKAMAVDTREVAGNIIRATGSLLRWASLTGVFSGLLGAGGLFGINRMATGVASGRRESMGLGISYGQQKAFEVNYGRLINAESMLSGVAESLHDISRRFTLHGAGLGEGDLRGRNTGDVASLLLTQLKRIADATPEEHMAQVLKARGLDQFIGLQDFIRLRATPQSEIAGYNQSYRRDIGSLGQTQATQRAWQDFTVQMDRAGRQINEVFVRGLVRLAPGMEKISEGLVKLIDAAARSPVLAKWMDSAGKGLEAFAEYIGTEEFRKNVRDLVQGIGDLAAAVVRGLRWLGVVGPTGAAPNTAAGGGLTTQTGMWGQAPQTKGQAKFNGWMNFAIGDRQGSDALLALVRRLEGSGDHETSRAGARGRYQIMPGTAKQYGFDPDKLFDPEYNKTVAQAVLADLMKRYSGDMASVLIAYNAGPGVANKFNKNGRDFSSLPRETQGYLERAGFKVKVEVNNNTGGNAVTSTSQVAQ